MFIDHDQLVGVTERQRLQQHRAHNGEERGRGANAECHDENSDQREAGRAAQCARAISNVTTEPFQPVPTPGRARLIAKKGWIAKFAQRRRPRRRRIHALGHILCDLLLQMELQLVAQSLSLVLSPKQH